MSSGKEDVPSRAPRLIGVVDPAPWLPRGGRAEAWAGDDLVVPDPCILVRILLTRGERRLFLVETERGPDLPSLRLDGATPADGLRRLAARTHGEVDAVHRCIGWIRNVVPVPGSDYPHPAPYAYVPVFEPLAPLPPTVSGAWVDIDAAADRVADRHWWLIVARRLNAEGRLPRGGSALLNGGYRAPARRLL